MKAIYITLSVLLIASSALAEPVTTQKEPVDDQRGYDQPTAEAFIEANKQSKAAYQAEMERRGYDRWTAEQFIATRQYAPKSE
ncbi:hypothetical protein JM93_03868 [Roseibium hamelinense]|uniref:DUF4148 domain-containing protein n=1 Tax=Roseibium hamelinense TaxID=150831 RepID=A0A562SMJ5_9HYPH|nr:hypothetical protein [Roseibium hamelinense]MTI43445.1 hypothetical protein [Roseibium hamelinense]TWI81906.1 hypothetical protein JM93_03868 [Roseibium hamelinense]